MDIYLIRHGIAVERGIYPEDAHRPLTKEGRTKTQKVAQRLREIGLRFNIILTSPLVRAKQTADILLKASLSTQSQEFIPLSPGGEMQDWLNWLTQNHYNCMALVGHQPDLGIWTETLVGNSQQGNLIVKKAGVIGVRITEKVNPMGNSQLFLLTSPKWLVF